MDYNSRIRVIQILIDDFRQGRGSWLVPDKIQEEIINFLRKEFMFCKRE
jgi:hypothetical protein